MPRAADDLETFYALLFELRRRLGGFRWLRDCDGRSGWPNRGVYFFFDERERRADDGLRVRVGTHALRPRDRTTLWGRLRNHRGNVGGRLPGGGNHRGSVFRFHVGAALLAMTGDPGGLLPVWMNRAPENGQIPELEYETECLVSRYIRDLPFLWVAVLDDPGPLSDRRVIESNSIALLSTAGREIDPPGEEWLGHHARNIALIQSGLWNVNHVDERYDPDFLATFERYVRQA
jgi:hypothetical protein